MNTKHSKPNIPIALKGVKVSSTTPTPLHDPMHKLREHYGGLSDSEETEILKNLAGFTSILHGWQVAYEAELQITPNKEVPDDETSDP